MLAEEPGQKLLLGDPASTSFEVEVRFQRRLCLVLLLGLQINNDTTDTTDHSTLWFTTLLCAFCLPGRDRTSQNSHHGTSPCQPCCGFPKDSPKGFSKARVAPRLQTLAAGCLQNLFCVSGLQVAGGPEGCAWPQS